MKDNRYFAVNWTDGVKISKHHFINTYYHTVSSIKDATQSKLHNYDYGLMESVVGSVSSMDLEILTQTHERLELRLQSCNAVTAGGYRIVFEPKMYGDSLPMAVLESKNIDINSHLFFNVVISVNPYDLVPVGEPDPEVVPLHHPHVLPKIKLEIIPENQFNKDFYQTCFLLVGKVQWRNGSFIVDKDYTPPTSKIKYHGKLHSFLQNIMKVMVNLRDYSVIINKKNRDKSQSNPLVRNTFSLCNRVLDFIGQYSFEFNQLGEEQPPIFIAHKISILSNYLANELSIMNEEEREKLLQYYYEWIDIKPSEFESTLGRLNNLKYDHNNINEMIEEVNYFVAIIDRLWKRLSELEYIGQRKDNIVVSEESIQEKRATKDRAWSIID
ncbi:MAG: hypothetical protein MI922_16655 [Bacteroidales bacterium]|nr:hypothetical protein [Bacteroidales bacterium]